MFCFNILLKTFSDLLQVRSLRCQPFLDGQTVFHTSEKRYVDSSVIGLQDWGSWLLFFVFSSFFFSVWRSMIKILLEYLCFSCREICGVVQACSVELFLGIDGGWKHHLWNRCWIKILNMICRLLGKIVV